MPYQPINPADLDGEELDAWYRRSPDEIEAARQATAQQAYDAFFNGAPSAADSGSADSDGSSYTDRDHAADPTNAGPALLQKVSYSPAGHTASAVASCPSCHQALPPSLPPNVFPGWPILRDAIGGGVPPSSSDRDPKQCDMQYRNDHQVCGRFSYPRDRGICRERAATRYDWCLRTDEVDMPIPLLRF